jgi:hypothetical protein
MDLIIADMKIGSTVSCDGVGLKKPERFTVHFLYILHWWWKI